jgi:hypothetical protein
MRHTQPNNITAISACRAGSTRSLPAMESNSIRASSRPSASVCPRGRRGAARPWRRVDEWLVSGGASRASAGAPRDTACGSWRTASPFEQGRVRGDAWRALWSSGQRIGHGSCSECGGRENVYRLHSKNPRPPASRPKTSAASPVWLAFVTAADDPPGSLRRAPFFSCDHTPSLRLQNGNRKEPAAEGARALVVGVKTKNLRRLAVWLALATALLNFTAAVVQFWP